MPVSPSRYELLERRVARFTRMLHGVEKYDVRGLHRTRVASRRLRELLPVLQLEGEVAGELGRRLRKITQKLGKVRELDVLLLLLESLPATGRYDPEALSLVGSVIARDREFARARLTAKLPLRELRRVAEKLRKLADEFERADDASRRGRTRGRALRWAVEARVHRRGSALKTAIDNAGAVYLPDRLHNVRIALKKFRYAVELTNEISKDPRMAEALRLLKRNQELLGRWHDRQVLIDRVRRLQAQTPPDISVRRSLDKFITTLETDCRRLHARYVRHCGAVVGFCDRFAARSPTVARRAG